MNSFTVKCNKCGKETTFSENMDKDNDIISVSPMGYGGEVGILCDCGNEVYDK